MSAADVLVLVAPQFTGDSRITAACNLAVARMTGLLDAVAPGSQESAVAYMAAHLLTLADRGSASGTSGLGLVGPVTSVSTGDLSVSGGLSLGNIPIGMASLASTSYGLALLEIVQNGPGNNATWVV